MATNFKSLQLLRNTTYFASKEAAVAGITGSTTNVSDGSIKLARYTVDGKNYTVFGIFEQKTGEAGSYTLYDSAADISQALSDAIAALSASTVGGEGKYITSIKEENGIITAEAADLVASAVTRTATTNLSATTVEDALEELAEDIKESTEAQTKYTVSALTGDDLSALGENVKEAYKLYAIDKDGNETATGAPIKIYKDSSIKEIYVGHEDDTVDETTGTVSKTGTGATSLNYVYYNADGKYSLTAVDIESLILEAEFANGLKVEDHVAKLQNDTVTVKVAGEDGITFDNGDKLNENDVYAADAIIEDTFKVLGGNVGQLKAGDVVSGGTTVIELLKKMLVKEADCSVDNPTCTLTISPTTSPVEVGTVVTETLSSTYTDGKFKYAADDYGKSTDEYVNAGCTQGTVTYKRGSTTVTSPDEYTMPDGTTTWSCTSTYAASTVTPKKNNGTDSSKTIAAGTTAESKKTITAYYKWYLGNTTAASVADIVLSGENANVSDVVTGWTSASTVTMKDTWSSNGKSIFVLVKGTLTSFEDNLSSVSLIPNFVVDDKKTIAIGGTSTATYKGYLWTITNGTVIKAKEIKFNKG